MSNILSRIIAMLTHQSAQIGENHVNKPRSQIKFNRIKKKHTLSGISSLKIQIFRKVELIYNGIPQLE